MSLELLYTSAASGLKQGSRGFCTVVSTSGMPSNLAQRMETLSGYRHVYSPQDPKSKDNPVNYSHVQAKVGGKLTSILSRVTAYGADYSGRTNKLAHHIALEASEHAPAGPSWIMQQPLMRESWDGNNLMLPTGPAIPSKNQPARVCNAWASLMGDAGWGGAAADMFSSNSPKPVWVIFDVTQSRLLLNLINESIALLPESKRWAVTFSTYYTSLPPEIKCRVRCVLAGSDEARLAAARGNVINLTKPTPVTSTSALVESARTGVVAQAPAVAQNPALTTKGKESDLGAAFDTKSPPSPRQAPPPQVPPRSLPPKSQPPKHRPTNDARPIAATPQTTKGTSNGQKAIIGSLVAVALAMVIGGLAFIAIQNSKRAPIAKVPDAPGHSEEVVVTKPDVNQPEA